MKRTVNTQKRNKTSRILLSLSIITFILGVGIQLYNYYSFKQFNWSLVKEEIDLNTIAEKNYILTPNLTTEYELILFYKKLIPKDSKKLDPTLFYNTSLLQFGKTLWQSEVNGINNGNTTLQGTEVVSGKFKLEAGKKYELKFNINSPTSNKGSKVMISVVTNQDIFKSYFYKAGIYELLFFLMFILSFVFFITFIILPHEKKDKI